MNKKYPFEKNGLYVLLSKNIHQKFRIVRKIYKLSQEDASLLLDVGMPVIDGYEVCKKLRLNDATKNLPIVFLSGFATQENIDKGFDVGVNDYITKPFSPMKLYEYVRSLLDS